MGGYILNFSGEAHSKASFHYTLKLKDLSIFIFVVVYIFK